MRVTTQQDIKNKSNFFGSAAMIHEIENTKYQERVHFGEFFWDVTKLSPPCFNQQATEGNEHYVSRYGTR